MQRREEASVIEHSAVKDNKGNGVVEKGVQSTAGQISVVRSTLEMRIGAKV